jgi:hypothetical protein
MLELPPEIIFRSYGKWIGGHEGFGKTALEATKTKPEPKPYPGVETQTERKQRVGMVRGGGFEPPRLLRH